MAEALAVMLSFPPDNVDLLSPRDYDKSMTSYVSRMGKIPQSQWLKQHDKQSLLELLDPAVNSLPYAATLYEQIKAVGKDKARQEYLFNHALIFFASFDTIQVRYLAEQWTQLLAWTMNKLQSASAPPDLSPIAAAMLRLDPTAGTFTTNHLHFLRACLQSGVPSQALPILDKNIYAFPTNPPKNVPDELLSEPHDLSNAFITPKSGFTDKVHPEHILEYYLLGAQIYIGQRAYPRARLFLEYVLLTPSHQHATSALQIEAYKKFALLGLLAQGKPYPLPRTHDGAVMKNVRTLAKAYDALAESFERRDWRKFHAEMDVGMSIWHEDGNLRMVREAGNALLRYRVSDLQRTFAALPVSRVASYMEFSPEDMLQTLTQMIRHGDLAASITPGPTAGGAVLRFHTSSATHSSTSIPSNTTAQEEQLEAQTKRIEDLVTFVRDADRRLQLTKEFVEHARRVKRQGDPMDMADQMDLTWDPPVGSGFGSGLGEDGDEDIMAV